MAKLQMRARLNDPKDLQRKLVADPMYGPLVQQLVRRTGSQIARKARDRAPGSLGSRVRFEERHTTSRGGFGIFQVRVRLVTIVKKGFRYAWALDASKKIKGSDKRYRYRSGPHKGKLTRNWFRGSRAGMTKVIKAGMDSISTAIQSWWGG